MNRIRIIGLIMLIIGIVLQFSFENDGTDFLTGLLVGGGIGLLITGQIKSKKKSHSDIQNVKEIGIKKVYGINS